MALRHFHEREPLKIGIDAASLINSLESEPSPAVAKHALDDLVEHGDVEMRHDLYAAAGFDPFARLGERERQLAIEMEREFERFGIEPPSPETVVGSDKGKQAVFRLLLDAGRLVRLRTYKNTADLVLHATALDDAKQAIERRFPYPAAFALKDIRDLLGSTRKFIVPLMEHFDAAGMTVRSGDMRRLRER